MLGIGLGLTDIRDVGGPFSAYAVSGTQPRMVSDYQRAMYGKPQSGKATRTTYTDLHASGGEMQGLITAHDRDGTLKHNAHNLFPYSEGFTNAEWAATRLAASVTSVTSPIPEVSYHQILSDDTSSTDRRLRLSTSFIPGASYTAKVTARDKDGTNLYLRFLHVGTGTSNIVVFDLSSGVVSFTGASLESASIEDLGNGDYLCLASVNVGSSVSNNLFDLGVTSSGNNHVSVVSVGDGCYITGAHCYRTDLPMADVPEEFRVGDDLTYVPTTSQARYLPFLRPHTFNGSEWVRGGIAVAPAATNKIAHAFDFTSMTQDEVTLADGPTDNPSGLGKMTKVTPSTSSAIHRLQISSNDGVSEVVTLYVKAAGYRYLTLGRSTAARNACFDLQTGTVTQSPGVVIGSGVAYADIKDVGGGLYRCTYVQGSATNLNIAVCETDDTGALETFAGDGTSGIEIWGLQEEEGAFPTPLIPTYGAAVARAAFNPDQDSDKHGISGNTSGVIKGKVSYADEGVAATQTILDCRANANNRITLTLDTDGSKTGNITLTMVTGGTSASVTVAHLSPGINQDFAISWRVSANDIALSVGGGTAVSTSTTIGVPDLSGASLGIGPDLNGAVDLVPTYPELTDAQLAIASGA